MAGSRLELIDPPAGTVLLIGAGPGDLAPFDPARTLVVQGFRPLHDAVAAQGFRVLAAPDTGSEGRADAAILFLPRARAEARAHIAAAAAALPVGGALWIDGQKTDGIDSVLREMRGLAEVDQVHSRAHGKIFRVTRPAGDWLPADWAGGRREIGGGFVTAPGVFSADGPDPASQALAAALPERLPTRIVELGAGWGWLAAHILTHKGVEQLHLVEADHIALDCARRNVTDPRAQFHWEDATTFRLPEPVNGVIMNPPFHETRAADPHLGARFIRAAAGLLTGAGRLWLVANRHLPYEAALAEHFAEVQEIGGDNRFKIITATGAGRKPAAKPAATRRRRR